MNGDLDSRTGHRILPHTADVIVEARGPNRSSCLEELVRGVVETFADIDDVSPTREIPLAIDTPRDEDVVVALVEDVLYQLDADGLVVVDLQLEEQAENGSFAGTFFVAPVDTVVQIGAAPKGVSRSELQFRRDDGTWLARVIIDV